MAGAGQWPPETTALRRETGPGSEPIAAIRASRPAAAFEGRVSRCPKALFNGSRPLAQKDVDRAFARDVLGAIVAQSMKIDALEEMLPRTE